MYSNGVRCERDGLFEVVEGSLLRQQTPLPTGSRYLLRKAIFVERLLGVVLGFDIRSFVQNSSSLVLAHAHRITTMTLVIIGALVNIS